MPGEWFDSDAGGRVAPMGPMFRASGIGAGGVGKAVTLFIGTGVVRLSKPEVIAAGEARRDRLAQPIRTRSRGPKAWDDPRSTGADVRATHTPDSRLPFRFARQPAHIS